MAASIPRPEYPRPDFERTEWLNLNGEWEFEFDDEDIGEEHSWFLGKAFTKKILVPYCFQSELSGINNREMHEILWYKREFELPGAFRGKRILLNFGAVDYEAAVWVNGVSAGRHKGGHVSFKMDITGLVANGRNSLVVKAVDRYECVQPRGKQYWKEKTDRCWYTPTSGIWQTVWLETAGELYIDRIRMTPDIDMQNLILEIYSNKAPASAELSIEVSWKGTFKARLKAGIRDRISKLTVNLKEEDYIDEIHYWSPENPNLYDIQFSLIENGIVTDSVKSYFGMRKISVKGDMILLNNKPYYQKLVLDQGYWPQSLITPPNDDAIIYDIRMTKELGFNGARKHQKIEDPRYYYWADRLGLLVWGEMPSPYDFNSEEIQNVTVEMMDFINRDYNHPCIVIWVPLNESWGVRNILVDKKQQNFARLLYYTIKAMDSTRLISTNDGWEQVESDICGIHDYIATGEEFTSKYMDKDRLLKGSAYVFRLLYANGVEYCGQPVILTEYGGIAFETDNADNWGYFGAVKDEKEFFERYNGITNAIVNIPYIRGYCYTQLTDVMQEVNGLMTADRKLKADREKIKKVNSFHGKS